MTWPHLTPKQLVSISSRRIDLIPAQKSWTELDFHARCSDYAKMNTFPKILETNAFPGCQTNFYHVLVTQTHLGKFFERGPCNCQPQKLFRQLLSDLSASPPSLCQTLRSPKHSFKSWLAGDKCVKEKMSQINNRQLQTFLNIKISTSLVEFVFVLNLDLYFPCLHHHHHHHCTICNSNSYILFQTFSSILTSLVDFVFVFLSFRVYYVYYLYVYYEVSGRRLNLLFKCVDCTATNGERSTVKVYRSSLV